MISEWGPYLNPSCDVCGRMLPAVSVQRHNGDREAARAEARAKMAAEGWTTITISSDTGGKKREADICELCAREGRRPKKWETREISQENDGCQGAGPNE